MKRSEKTTVTVSSKGWIVIPAHIRKKMGLQPGTKVSVREDEGQIVLTPQSGDPVDRLYGKLAGGDSLTDALLQDRAEEKNAERSKVHSR